MNEQGVEVWSGGVNTWECDEMGHMNVRFWVAKAQEGLAGLAALLGMPRAFARDGESTLVVREQHIRFLREAKPGVSLHMTGGVIALGECDARLLLVIRHMDGQPAATFQLVVDHATTRDLRPFPWPQRLREQASALFVEVPAFAAARSIDLSPVVATASLQRADKLGLKRIGLGVIGPAECDVFERMRPEIFIGRVSDGVGRLFGEPRPGPADGDPEARIGGAVLEYRVLHLDWPQAGDGIELRSGFAGCDARTRRVMHWMVDPQSGRPWASAEAVVVSFDLDQRKVVDISEEAQAAFRAASPPGLAL
ncbi:MAG: thioesterase [Phenylobacterium sp.]|uniref:thioesterase family protein n=1 Tax=Phenylobacterium sp. TaxID=1871053 RepID=UPI0025F64CF5|nr:thioesterase family protein [Phenylobacterium sp.]MBA4013607.1 thioesterase [Phenylobacterium sp.]